MMQKELTMQKAINQGTVPSTGRPSIAEAKLTPFEGFIDPAWRE